MNSNVMKVWSDNALTRQGWLIAKYLISMTLVMSFTGGANAQTSPRLKATLGVAGSSSQLALLAMNVARGKGYIKDEGLDLEVTDYGTGAKGLQSLVGRNSEMVIGVHEHTLIMQAKGVDLRSIVAFSNAPGIVLAITKNFEPKFKTIKDLKGAKIGVSAPGSSTHLFLNQVLVQNGLKPSDVSIIGIGNAAGAVAAVRHGGELQAIVNFDPVISELEQSGDIKTVIDLRNIEAAKNYYKRDYTFLTLYTTADFIQKNPAVCQAIVNGIVRALKWMETAKPEEILATIPEAYWKSNRELYLNSIARNQGGFSRDGRMTAEGTKTLYDGLMTYDKEIQASKFDLSKTYDNQFVEKALLKEFKK